MIDFKAHACQLLGYLRFLPCRCRKNKRANAGYKEERNPKKRLAAKPASGPPDDAEADGGASRLSSRHDDVKTKKKAKAARQGGGGEAGEARRHPALCHGEAVSVEVATPVAVLEEERAVASVEEESRFALPW